jgi:hypothetical protein
MSAVKRYAPVLAIVGLLLLVAFGGGALANNQQAPQVAPADATIELSPTQGTATSQAGRPTEPGSVAPDEAAEETAVADPAPRAPAAPAQPAAPVQPAPPQPPVAVHTYPDWDDDWDDDDDDEWDDDWDDDDWDDDDEWDD